MMTNYSFPDAFLDIKQKLRVARIVHPGRWQGIDVSKSPEAATHEVLNHSFSVKHTNMDRVDLQDHIQPDLPWADDHFEERVLGSPLNPPPSEAWWPHAPKGNDRFKDQAGIFSHTYPERYWPKKAGIQEETDITADNMNGLRGIRFPYGDLGDLVTKLKEDPLTRSAYLPVWFPEDLGMAIGDRKPCSLGYQFIMRNDQLHIIYYIRSCDFFRHFRNDVYMTVRLQHWVLDQLRVQDDRWNNVTPGSFTMHITSLHLFRNDYITLFGE